MKLLLLFVIFLWCIAAAPTNISYLDITESGTYNLYVNSDLWLSSSDIRIYLNNEWHVQGTPSLNITATSFFTGYDPVFGKFQGAEFKAKTIDKSGVTPIICTIRAFEDDFYLFDTTFPEVTNFTNVGGSASAPNPNVKITGEREMNSSVLPFTQFPAFQAQDNFLTSQLGFAEWHGRFASDSNVIGTGLNGFQGGAEGGPLLLFDVKGLFDRDNAYSAIISPFSHFTDSIASLQNGTLAFGGQGYLQSIPEQFTFTFGITLSQYGINAVVDKWGLKLRSMYNTTRLDEALDPVNNKISYWTDNGAYYYWGYWDKHANETAEEIMLNLYQYWANNDIPIGSIQFDPWWWIGGQYGWCKNWTETPSLFPRGLSWLKDQIPIPFLLYSSVFSPDNVYATENKFPFLTSNYYNLTWVWGQIGVVDPSYSFEFFDYIMGNKQKELGGFEVDFMDFQNLLFDQLVAQPDSFYNLMKGMNDAALKYQISIQYCMELPSDLLMTLSFPAVTNARASEDDFPTNLGRWAIGMTSMLHRAVGLGPFFDDFWTTPDQPGNPYDGATENNAELWAIISSLSAGPVGISDGYGYTNLTLLMKTCSADGTILKPSLPAIPIDFQFLTSENGGPPDESNIWSTFSEISEIMWYHVLAVSVTPAYKVHLDWFWPRPTASQYYVKNSLTPCVNGAAATSCVTSFNSSWEWSIQTDASTKDYFEHALFTLSPVFNNGWAFLGEVSKFVPTSPKRFTAIVLSDLGVQVKLIGSASENIELVFVNPQQQIVITNVICDSSDVAGPCQAEAF